MKTKKLLSTCTFLLLFCLNLAAQTDETKKSAVHISFFPPLSTHGAQASQYTNDFSFSIIAGISRNENAFAFASVSNMIINDAKGIQFAGVFNYIGNDARGLEFSGVTNIVRNNFSGLQFTGVMNLAQEMTGLQFAGVMNKSEYIKGFQLVGVGNIAADVDGMQFSAVFNKARKVRGVQFAAILNIAEESDYSIGLINIIKNGDMGIGLTYNESGSTVASFRSGGRVMYGILGVGFNHKAKKEKFVTEGGFGAHIPVVDWFRFNTELVATSITSFSDDNALHAGFRLLPSFKVLPHLEIFGGPSINFMTTNNPENHKDMFPKHNIWKSSKEHRLSQVFLGYTVGTQFTF